jgi:hypothetical protein
MGLFDRFFGPPGKEQFAHLMAGAIREAGEKAKLRYDAEQFSLNAEEVPSNTFYLANAYAEYCAAPKAGRPDVVRRFVRSWFSPRKGVPDDFADARTDLLPGLRNRCSFELTPLRMRAEGKGETAWPYRVLAGHLGVGLVYDLPESMMQLQENTLAKWGVTIDDALAVARDNLMQISGRDFEQPSPGVWLSPWRDNYDASRLTIPELLRRYEVQGDLVVAVPNRDVLLLTGSDDETGLGYLLAQVEEHMQKPRPLSAIPVRLDGDTWLPYRPDPDSPLYGRFRLLSVQSTGQDYAEQGEVLKALHERTGEDVFVARYTAMKREDEVVSYCVWSEGVDALLPRADEIFFFRPGAGGEGEIVGDASWDAVAGVAGGLLEPCGLYPERYRVRSFPTPGQLTAILGPKEGGSGG